MMKEVFNKGFGFILECALVAISLSPCNAAPQPYYDPRTHFSLSIPSSFIIAPPGDVSDQVRLLLVPTSRKVDLPRITVLSFPPETYPRSRDMNRFRARVIEEYRLIGLGSVALSTRCPPRRSAREFAFTCLSFTQNREPLLAYVELRRGSLADYILTLVSKESEMQAAWESWEEVANSFRAPQPPAAQAHTRGRRWEIVLIASFIAIVTGIWVFQTRRRRKDLRVP